MYFLFSFVILVLIEAISYLFGNSLLRVLKYKTEIENLKLAEGIKVFLGLFTIGNILFILNFFFPLRPNVLIPLFCCILIFQRKNLIDFFNNNLTLIIASGILLFSVYTNNPSTDSFKYHFFNQSLLTNSKLIIGLSNFDMNYGILSIFEYISSVLWSGNNYYFIQFINIIFLAGFFNFIYYLFNLEITKYRNISLIFLFIGLFDNFGFGGGRNGFIFIQEIGKFDSSVAVSFVITFIYLVYVIDNNLNSFNTEFLILLFLSTFLLQIRSFYYTFFGMVIIYLFLNKKFKDLKNVTPVILINILWIIKNVLTTSCLIFPVQITCLNFLPWSFKNQAKFYSLIATTNNRNPNEHIIEVFDFSWVKSYWISENFTYLLNILITCLIVFFIFKFSIKKTLVTRKNYFYKLLILINILSWFILYPNYRFICGVILILYIVILDKYLNENSFLTSIINTNTKFFILLFICVFFTPRISTYIVAIENLNINLIEKYEIKEIVYEDNNESYGVRPVGMFCYNNYNCSTSKQITELTTFFNFKAFIPINISMYEEGSISYIKKNY